MAPSEVLSAILHYKRNIDKICDSPERALKYEERLLHCIHKLYRLPVNINHLQETGIGKTVNSLRKIEGEKGLGDAAKALVAKWKTMVMLQDEADRMQMEEPQSTSTEEDIRRIRLIRDAEKSHARKTEDSRRSRKRSHNDKSKKKSESKKVNSLHDGRERKRKYSDEGKSSNGDDHGDRYHSKVKKRSPDPCEEEKVDDEAEVEKYSPQYVEPRSHEESKSKEKKKEKSEEKHNGRSEERHKSKDEEKHKNRGEEKHRNRGEERHKSRDEEKHRSKGEDRHKSRDEEKHGNRSEKHNSSPEKSEKKSESKSKHSSSSSSSSESKSKPSKHESNHINHEKSEAKKSKVSNAVSEDEDGGIDCHSGASFADALGPMIVKKAKKKFSQNVSVSQTNVPSEKVTVEKKPKKQIDITHPPVEPLEPDLISTLPVPTPHYKPSTKINLNLHEASRRRIQAEEDALNSIMSNKNQRTKVYSGVKGGLTYVPTLYEFCCRVLQQHLDAIEYTGGIPYSLLKPILDGATPAQLFQFEHFNPYIIEDTDHLWKFHVNKEFRNESRQEFESWRDMYLRCIDEREEKYKAVTANIQKSIERSAPVRKAKLAYIDVAKPPRNILRKQIKNGIHKPEAARLLGKNNPEAVKVAPPKQIAAKEPPTIKIKPKVAPLMQKTLKSIKMTRFKR